MTCCILSCANNKNTVPPPKNITYYRIPTEYHLKQLWIEAIGMSEWELKPNSEVCSAHFHKVDFAISGTGEKKLVGGAVPNLRLHTQADLQALATYRTCRVCLGMDRKMHHIRDCNLHHAYEMILGEMVDPADGMPQMLCWECTSKLISLKTFQDKARKSHLLLLDILAVNKTLTVGDIKAINRIEHKLQSHLTMRYKEPHEIDSVVDHDDVTEQQDIKIEIDRIKHEPANFVLDGVTGFKTEDDDVKNGTSLSNSDSNLDMTYRSDSDSDDVDLSKMRTAKKRKVSMERKTTAVKKKRGKKVVKEDKSKHTAKSAQQAAVSQRAELHCFDTRRLSPEEQRAAVQARARSAAFLAAPHKCTVCYRGFKTAEAQAAHAVYHDEKRGKFACPVCRRRFRLACDVRQHVERCHSRQFSCRLCSFVTKGPSTALRHQQWHAGDTHACPHCPSVFDKFTSYMSHLRIKHASRFACELCGYTFVSEHGVELHKAKRHRLQDAQMKLAGPYCEECKLRFANDKAYLRHLTQSSVHSSDSDPNRIRNEWGYKDQLGVVRRSRKRRAPGVVTHWAEHADRPKQNIPCEQCGEQMDSYRTYAQHFRMAHPGLNRTKFSRVAGACMCEQCGKMFACKTLLLDHMMSHSGEKRFKCDTCDKAFTNKNNLAVHQRVHGAQVPTYRCPHCERQFFHYQNCYRHVKTVHKGVKQFQCEICGKEFTSAAGQRAHVDHVHHKKPRPKRVRARAPPAPAPAAYRHW